MSVFDHYAEYYNLLYKDKNYKAEVGYLNKLINTYAPKAKTILNLGCGTGNHDVFLSDIGYEVTGVDQSKTMLKIAAQNIRNKTTKTSAPTFLCGDIRGLKLDKKFDVVLSLFHVISYLPTNDDVRKAFKTVRNHLKSGGIFIFDVWYGPAVLTCRPEVKFKKMENEKISVSRIAEPLIYPDKNIVDVNYTIFIQNKRSGAINEIKETHKMRYFFTPEMTEFFKENNFKHVLSHEWMSGNSPALDTWGVCFVVKK